MIILIILITLANCENDPNKNYNQFFYNKIGMLTIDGEVPGMSDLITMDLKPTSPFCGPPQYFKFTFCPKKITKPLQGCEEGIAFCYEPQLTQEKAIKLYVLNDYDNNDVSKKCGKNFRGFKVALKQMRRFQNAIASDFYEIQLSYMEKSYYFPITKKPCIELWLGNERNLATTVREINGSIIEPVQVWDGAGMVGVDSSAEGNMSTFPDVNRLQRFANHPGLQLLYLDFKSGVFMPQWMFTMAPEKEGTCNMIARVRSNTVSMCTSQFRQKTTALRAYGNGANTTYGLTLSTGIVTKEKRGQKSITSQLIEQQFETETEETETDEQSQTTLQSQEDKVVDQREELVASKITGHTEVEDVTPFWKKLASGIANIASAATCAVASIASLGLGGCSSNLEMKETKTTSVQDSFTEKNLHKTTQHSKAQSTHSMLSILSQSFKHTQGHSQSTSKTIEQVTTMTITDRTVFKWVIDVPDKMVLTPMQMIFDCDGNRMPIPWMKFILSNQFDDAVLEDYPMENNPV